MKVNGSFFVRPWFWLAAIIVVAGFGATLGRDWLVGLFWRPRPVAVLADRHADDDHADHKHDDHEHDDHEHASKDHKGHDPANSLELSVQARGNIGLTLMKVQLRPFEKTITVPGIVVERTGRTMVNVTAPMTGVITRIAAIQGEAVEVGQPLFELRLSHEELVQAQADYLRTAEELDVIEREIVRIEKFTESGTIPGKTLIERNYEKQKAEAVLHAQSQALLLHGLTEEQVRDILARRKLLEKLSVTAPALQEQPNAEAAEGLLQVHQLKVEQGQHVVTGETLCVLVNHAQLYIEASAFEQDSQAVSLAAEAGQRVTAVLEANATPPESSEGLQILYVADQVDMESRAFHFYVVLPNQLLGRPRAVNGHQFISWRFKPGQRMRVRVPVERWEDRIVLPVEAIASEGAESYVFQANGDHFDRRPVRVEYRDESWAVIANDGSLFPGDVVAETGAHQLQTAMKNKSGGAIDPHAGHNH